MGEKHENTNLASEFYVLSMLYRNGINATLTLGNKKAVDIVIEKDGKVITLDVKGAQKKSGSFPMENVPKKAKANHYYAFVILKAMDELPEVYIVPSNKIDIPYPQLRNLKGNKLLYYSPHGRHTVDFNRLRKLRHLYENKWEYFK